MRYPPGFTNARYKVSAAQATADRVADIVPARDVVVQAGGCAGVWPLALADRFARVITFEPEAENFACLLENIATHERITARRAALGAYQAQVGLSRPKAEPGLWRVDGDGEIPLVRLDDELGDLTIDALVLDVEGSEVEAWQGAARLIARDRPLLWFEFLQQQDAINGWLKAHGYTPPMAGIGGDAYSVHRSRLH